MNRILNPEDGYVQNQIPHCATADAGDDGEPHEAHHVHAFARGDERSGHGEHNSRKNVEEMDETEQVRGIDHCGLHTLGVDGADPVQYAPAARLPGNESFAMSKSIYVRAQRRAWGSAHTAVATPGKEEHVASRPQLEFRVGRRIRASPARAHQAR